MAGAVQGQAVGVQDDQHPVAWQEHGQGAQNVKGRSSVSKAALTAALQRAAGVGGVGRRDNTMGLKLGMAGAAGAPREVPNVGAVMRDTGYQPRVDNTTSAAHTGEQDGRGGGVNTFRGGQSFGGRR